MQKENLLCVQQLKQLHSPQHKLCVTDTISLSLSLSLPLSPSLSLSLLSSPPRHPTHTRHAPLPTSQTYTHPTTHSLCVTHTLPLSLPLSPSLTLSLPLSPPPPSP